VAAVAAVAAVASGELAAHGRSLRGDPLSSDSALTEDLREAPICSVTSVAVALGHVLDDRDELIEAIALPTSELDELAGSLDIARLISAATCS
jgi:hypothetical protein